MSPQRLYLAFTPYHLILSLALQHRDGHPDAAVLFADEARILSHAPGIKRAAGEMLDLRIAPTLEGHHSSEYPLRCRLLARSAQRFIREAGLPEEIYVSNGLRPESQRLFRMLGDRTSFKFVEDGFDSYISCNRAEIALWHRCLHRMLCGTGHPSNGDMVGALPYASFHVVAPELCRAPQPMVEAIPPASLRFATNLLEAQLPRTPPDRPITDLFLLANSERMSDPGNYLDGMEDWVQTRVEDDPTNCVAVKAHPREKDPRMMARISELGDYLVPYWIPAELLTGHLSPRVWVHSGLTTFVVSSRQLLPERRVQLDETVREDRAAILHRWDPAIEQYRAGNLTVQPVERRTARQP